MGATFVLRARNLRRFRVYLCVCLLVCGVCRHVFPLSARSYLLCFAVDKPRHLHLRDTVAGVQRCADAWRSDRNNNNEHQLNLCVFAAAAWRQWTWEDSSGPGGRRGHSLVVYDTQLIVFGGRTEDSTRAHVPKTYEIQDINGSLEFISYDDKIGNAKRWFGPATWHLRLFW